MRKFARLLNNNNHSLLSKSFTEVLQIGGDPVNPYVDGLENQCS